MNTLKSARNFHALFAAKKKLVMFTAQGDIMSVSNAMERAFLIKYKIYHFLLKVLIPWLLPKK